MGSKQTKIDEKSIQEKNAVTFTADAVQDYNSAIVDSNTNRDYTVVSEMDPRSPNGTRTPIHLLSKRRPVEYGANAENQKQVALENPFLILRKRLLKGIGYNLQDPRSPSMHLNRTPLIFEENDRTFNMNDTFADLFVDSRAPQELPQPIAAEADDKVSVTMEFEDALEAHTMEPVLVSPEMESEEFNSFEFTVQDEETMPCPVKLNQTPVELQQQQIDPRSPTIGVDRTPIIFNDDDEANEDAAIENILAVLSLNTSGASSASSSFAVTSSPAKAINADTIDESSKAPTNKHLQRVRNNGRRQQKTCTQRRQRQRQRIYEDENQIVDVSTPKKRYLKDNNANSENRRTPLSCVKNRTNLRSRSVESNAKSLKMSRMQLTSFDDSLNMLQTKTEYIRNNTPEI